MKRLILTALQLLLVCHAPGVLAEMFFGPSSATNKLVVGTGQALLITGVFASAERNQEGEFGASCVWATPQGTNRLTIFQPTSPCALAGPGELVANGPLAVSYHRISTTNLVTVYVSSEPVNIEVKAGKRLRFLAPLGKSDLGFGRQRTEVITLVRGQSTVSLAQASVGDEIHGPVRLTMSWSDKLAYLASFTIDDIDAVSVHEMNIELSPGSHLFEIQKSADLVNWSTSALIPLTSETQLFLRLKSVK